MNGARSIEGEIGEPEEIATETVEVEYVRKITIDYDRSREDAIEDGQYDWVNDKIIKTEFAENDKEKGKKEVNFKIFSLRKGRSSQSQEAIEQMEQEGYRPATLKELLAFGAVNPEFQTEFPVNALGEVVSHPEKEIDCVFEIFSVDGERRVTFQPLDKKWDRYCRFLGVLKEEKE